jgi:hypothetical protein
MTDDRCTVPTPEHGKEERVGDRVHRKITAILINQNRLI